MLHFILFLAITSYAQMPQLSLHDFSNKLNTDLPEIYDPVTKLIKTTVDNNNLIYNFVVNADQGEFNWAMPKVKSQVMSMVCSKAREKAIFKNYKANIVYRYENVKGQSLGEFMIKPENCPGK